jgi:hypothetical protein
MVLEDRRDQLGLLPRGSQLAPPPRIDRCRSSSLLSSLMYLVSAVPRLRVTARESSATTRRTTFPGWTDAAAKRFA